MKKVIFAIGFILCLFTSIEASDYYVDALNGNNITGDGTQAKPWKSITFALTQVTTAAEVHTIHAASAVYDTTLETFPIRMKNKVSLVGAERDVTILDAKGTETVIRCENVADSRTRIEGFTIMSGQGQYIPGEPTAGGIQLVISSPTIINNVIKENRSSEGYKVGIRCIEQSSPVIENNLISENRIEIGLSWKPSVASNSIIRNNSFDKCGILIECAGSPLIEGNTIRGNSGYAIECSSILGGLR